jgi:hypothetical protein
MWRSAQNLRITYTPLPPKNDSSPPRIDDLVQYESSTGKGGVKNIKGIDTATLASEARSSDTSVWDWRGKGWLAFVTSHWEVLGWGERERDGRVERWVVTWFAPTLFTKEGVDVYSDHPSGGSNELIHDIMNALVSLDAHQVVDMVEKDMRPVQISMPWKEK